MLKKIFLAFIRFYQKTRWFHQPLFRSWYLSDKVCRFTPSCSEYSYQAIDKYGIIKGSWLAFKRIVRCHPWSAGGKDPLR